MELIKRIRKDFWGHSLILSLGLHGLLLILISALNFYYPQVLINLLARSIKEAEKPNILIELEKEKEEDELIDLSNPLVSLQNLLARGKLTEKKGVHLMGNPSSFVMVTLDPKPYIFPKQVKEDKKDEKQLVDEGELPIAETAKKQEKILPSDVRPDLEQKVLKPQQEILTENSLRFRFNLNGSFQDVRLGSRKFKHAEFYQNFIRSLEKNFLFSRTIALYRKDVVRMVVSVTRTGVVQFEGWESYSKSQRGLNNIALKTVEYASRIEKVPSEFFSIHENKAYFPYSLEWSGPPAYLWGISIGVPQRLEEKSTP